MSLYENGLDTYIEQRLIPKCLQGECYTFRNNSFAGRITRYDGSSGWIKNAAKGTPDRIMLYRGKFIGLELKSPKGVQSPEQKRAQALIESSGGLYRIIKTPEDFEELLAFLASSPPSEVV